MDRAPRQQVFGAVRVENAPKGLQAVLTSRAGHMFMVDDQRRNVDQGFPLVLVHSSLRPTIRAWNDQVRPGRCGLTGEGIFGAAPGKGH